MATPTTDTKPRLAYLVSQLPALSHTFILREIQALQARGFSILPISVNRPDRPFAQLSAKEQALAAQSIVLKDSSVLLMLAALAHALLSRLPWLLGALLQLPARSGSDLRQLLWQFAYLLEAILTGYQLQRQGIRHLHVHFATPAASVGVWCKEIYGISLSLTVHGPDEFSAARHYRLAEKVAKADWIICISQFCRSQLMLHSEPQHWHKFEVILLGVDLSPALPRASKPRGLQLCSIGRLAPAKGQMLLLQAFARLHLLQADSHLTLIGTGPLEPQIRDFIREQRLEHAITLTGGLRHDEAMARLAAADAFVMASFAEGVPIVLMEAMMRGIPCVATRIAGIPELIDDQHSGLLVPAGDCQSLYLALLQLCQSEKLRERLAAAARQRVLARYHIENNADHLAAFMQQRLQLLANQHSDKQGALA